GWAGRFTRLGTLSSAGNSWAPSLLWGLSHRSALAGDSAVFAGLERGLTSPKGQARFQSFAKSWASAAINLGSLKLLGGISEGQNLILQHLLVDTGMVAGHNIRHALILTDTPT